METRTFKLSSYDISPSNNLADYYKNTVTTQYGTVADNRMSLTWNNVNLQQIVGNDFYNSYNRFTIKLVNQSWYGTPTSDSGTTYSAQNYQDQFVNVYLKGLPFYPPVYNSPDGALVNTLDTGILSTTVGGTVGRSNVSNSINRSFLKTSTASISINIRCVGTEQPYSPADVSTYLWGHSVYHFEIAGIPEVSNVSYVNLSNNSVLNNGMQTIYTELVPDDTFNYVGSSRVNNINVITTASSLSFSQSIPSSIVYETNLTNVLVATVAEQNSITPTGTITYYVNNEIVTASTVLDYGSYMIYALFTSNNTNFADSFATVNLIVTKKSTVLSYSAQSSVVYGTSYVSVLNASCTIAGTIEYYYDNEYTMPVTTSNINAGTYTVYAVFTPSTENYSSSTVSSSFTVTPAPSNLVYNALPAIAYETAITDSLNATTAVEGTTNYYLDSAHSQLISPSDVLNAGAYTIYAVFTPSSSNYQSSNASATLTVNKYATAITFPNITSFVYETTLNDFISGTTARNIPGAFTFHINSASGTALSSSTVLNGGTYTIYCKFTPTNSANYLFSESTTTLTVTSLSTTINYSSSIISSIVYNTGLTDVLSTTVTPNVAGTTSYYYINSSSANVAITSTTILNVGSYTIYATFTPSTADYASSTTSTPLTVTQATPVVTYSNLPNIIYETTLSSSLNATASDAGTFSYYLNANKTNRVFSTTLLNAGIYTIYAFFTPSSSNYTTTSQSTSLTVNKLVPEIEYTITSSIVYGTTISQSLNATCAWAGSISYYRNSTHTDLILSTDVFNAGIYTIYALFTPSDSTNYSSVSTSETLTVTRKPTSLTFPNISSFMYETTLAAFITGTTVSDGVTGIYNFHINNLSGASLASTTVLSVGTYTIFCQFVPSDSDNYLPTTKTKSLTVTTHGTTIAYTPSIPSSVSFGTKLTQVLSTSVTPNVAGSIKYYKDINLTQEVNADTVLDFGTYTISAVFTPTSSDYMSSSTSTSLSVTKVATTITYPSLSNIVYGTTLSSSFTAFVSPSIQGAFNYYYMVGTTQISLNSTYVLNSGTYTIYVDFVPSSSNYSGSSSQQSLTVTTLSTTVIYNTLPNIVYPTTLSSSLNATVYPNINGSMKYFINGLEVKSTKVLTPGSYSISAIFTPVSINYSSSTSTKSLTVAKITPTITFPTISSFVYETTLAGIINGTTVSDITGTFEFFLNNASGASLSSSTVLEFGTYTIFCRFVPDDTTFYQTSTATKSLSVTAVATTLSYSPSIASSIVYETTLTNILQTTVSPTVPGTTVYSVNGTVVNSSTVMNVGNHVITATFTPTDDEYSQSTATTSLTVTAASTTLSYTIPSTIVYGTTMNSSLSATSAKPGTIAYYYDSLYATVANSNDVLDVGSYTLYAVFTPSTANYLSSTASASVTVSTRSTALAFAPSTPSVITYETSLSNILNATVTPSVAGTIAYYYLDSGSRVDVSVNTVLNAGSYTIQSDFTPSSSNYGTSSATTSVMVSQKPITVTYSGLSAITYGTTLSSSLNATLSQTVDGTLSYYTDTSLTSSVISTTVLNAGSYTIYAKFTPTSANYVSYTVNTGLTVNKATPIVTYDTLPSIAYGTTLQSSFTASANVSGTIAYFLLNDPIIGSQILNAGTYTLRAQFTPTDATNYESTFATSSLIVSKRTPTITFASISTITYETSLSSFVSGTTASVAGTFLLYLADSTVVTSSTVLNAGSYAIYASFTPSDTTNYTAMVVSSTSLQVQNKATSITLSSISSIVYGTTLASFISGTTASVPGTLQFNLTNVNGTLLTPSTILNAESYEIFCTFTPTDPTNYLSSTASRTSFVVSKQPTTITLSSINTLTYGNTLASFISGTTSSDTGTLQFRINDESGQLLNSTTILNAGTYTIYTAFTPSDSLNYLSSSSTKSLTVQKQSTSITMSSINSIIYTTTLSSFISGTTSSPVPGSLNFYITDATGQQLTSSSVLTVSTYLIYSTFEPNDSTNYLPSTNSKPLQVVKQTSTITFSSISTVEYGDTTEAFINGTTSSVPGTLSFFLNDAYGQQVTINTILNAATYTIFCKFDPTDATNYTTATATKQLTTVQKQMTVVYGTLSAITYGTTLIDRLNATFTPVVDGSMNYYVNSVQVFPTTVLNAKSTAYTIVATFTPSNSNYTTTSTSSSLIVNKAPTTVTYPALESILYNIPIGGACFIATASPAIDGAMTYFTDSLLSNQVYSNTILAKGNYTLYAKFTPTSTNYAVSSASSPLTVLEILSTTITFPSVTTVAVYTTLAAFINATTTGVAGTYVFRKNNNTGAILTTTSTFDVLGNFTIFCSFTPTSNLYLPTSSMYIMSVKYTPTLLFNQRPSSTITYGTNLSGNVLATTVSQFNNTNIPGTITFSNNRTTASILLPGIYTIVATFTPTNLSYYNTVTTTKQILVNKQQLTVMITTPSVKAAFIKSSPITSTYQVLGILTDIGDTFENSVSGTIVNKYMSSDESEVLTSQYVYNTTFSGAYQTYKIAADIQGFSSTKYNFTSQSYIFTINKYTPAIAYTISSANKTLSYGTKLGANQLNAVVSYNGTPVTTGSIVYTRSVFNMSQTVDTQTALDVGQYNLYAYYSDPDGNIYNSVNTSTITANQITIVKATPVISFPNINSILAGTDLNNILGFTVANFNSAIIDGTFVFSYVNQSDATIVVNSSSVLTQPPSVFTISAAFTPTDPTRYSSATGSVTITLSDQPSTLNTTTLLQSPIIYGKTFNELYTISVSPSIAGTYTYYDDVYAFNPASILDAGTYTYTVIFNPTSTTYASSLVDLTFTIENASLTLSYQSAPAYVYQTANQLSLVQPVKSVAVDGQMQIFLDSSFTTELTNATAMAVGTHTLYARFTPTKNYNVATVTTTLTITKIPTSLVYATQTSSITYGATNSSFLNNMVVDSIPGTIQYYYDSIYSLVATSTDVIDYGTHTIYTRFVPTDSNYAIAYATHTVNVGKVVLTMTYPTVSSIQYGTTLESSLSASATFDGSINYFINSIQVFANTQLNSGSYTITAIFTPTKPINFTTQSISITRPLTVSKQSTSITYSPANIVSGTTFGSIMTAIVAPNIAGTVRYFINNEEVTSSVVLSSGNYTVYVSFTPTNLTNYVSSSISVPFAVVSNQELTIFNDNVQQIQTASNNEILSIVTQNAVLSSPTMNVKVNILNPGQTTFTSNVTNSLVTGLQFNFLDNSMISATRVAVSTLSVNLPSAPNSPAIYFKFYDETGNSVINSNNRVSLVLNLPQYKGITKNLYLLRLQDIGTTFDGTQIPLTPVNPTNSQNIAFTAVFTSNSIYVANIISSNSDETPLLSNLYTFNATGGFVMERGFDDIKLREDTDVELYDVTDSVQVLFDVALFNSKLGLNKNDTNTQVLSSMFNSITDQFEINNEAIDSITLSSSEFSDGLVKSKQIISVGRYSTLYSDFKNYVAAYFGFDGGFSSLFTAASEFKIDGDNHFDSQSMLQLFTNVSTSETGAYFNQVSGNITVTNITKSLRHAINTNCFGNRNPTVSGTATDPANHSNYGIADGFVAGDLIWVNAGTTVKLNLNIDTEALTPLNNVGPQNTLLQTTNYNSSNFSQETIATTTNINRIVKAPLLIKLVNASTISAL